MRRSGHENKLYTLMSNLSGLRQSVQNFSILNSHNSSSRKSSSHKQDRLHKISAEQTFNELNMHDMHESPRQTEQPAELAHPPAEAALGLAVAPQPPRHLPSQQWVLKDQCQDIYRILQVFLAGGGLLVVFSWYLCRYCSFLPHCRTFFYSKGKQLFVGQPMIGFLKIS